MIPHYCRFRRAEIPFPRMSGDDPYVALDLNELSDFSPHERG